MKRIILFILFYSCLNSFGQTQRLIVDTIAIGVKPAAKINLDGSITARNFNGKRAITGSVATGQNPNTNDIIAWLNAVFYPSQVPTATLSGGILQELRAPGTSNYALNWQAGRQVATANILSVVVNGINQTFVNPAAPGTVAGNSGATVTHNVDKTVTNEVTTVDGKIAIASTSFTFLPRRYWGRTANSNAISEDLLASAGGSSVMSGARSGTFTITASGTNRIFFAYPSSFGDLTSINVGGLESLAAFVKTVISFTNASGFTQNYNIYTSINPTGGNATITTQ